MKEPPKARFVAPPAVSQTIHVQGKPDERTAAQIAQRSGELLPLPETTMGVWGGDEPRERLPADTSYLNPHGEDWRERQRAESRLIAVLAVIVTAGVVGWVCWVLTA